MNLEIGFGMEPQTVDLPDRNVMDILHPNEVTVDTTGAAEVERALDEPIGTACIEDIVRGKQKIVIVTSDITRPMPSHVVLPPLLERIYGAGGSPEAVTIVFALGSHRRHTEQEKRRLVGDEIYETCRCIDSSESGFVHMGTTPGGTPVDICRTVAEADCRICLGNIEYHYFAGYSGGAKAIMPGVSTRAAIQANHSRMVDPLACTGALEGNPLRRDLEDSLVFCPVDFIVNVVLDEHKQIVRCVCGDIIAAHRSGCRFLDRFYRKEIKDRADIVLVSQGGHPKDLNLYQTQKALENAKYAVRENGIIILVGSCREGMGEQVFEDWMLNAKCPGDLTARIQQDFQLGGHKAAAIAMVLEHARVFLVSHMDQALVQKIFMTPFSTVQEAVDAAMAQMGPEASILVMPYGGSTLPYIKEKD